MKLNTLFEQLISGTALSTEAVQEIIECSISGSLSDVQIAVFLALMRMKGETVEELTIAAKTLKQHANSIDLGPNLIDIVGTGGDRKNTFNISTISSFVAAAAGCSVAKHGNVAISGKSGSADLLKAAGFILELPDDALKQCMKQCNIAFLFAPHFHKALAKVKQARQELGIRTMFNLLGPLLNPANVTMQVVGVAAPVWLRPIAEVLAYLGSEHALVLNAHDGLDEISISSKTDVIEYHKGSFKAWTIDPKDYDCAHPSLNSIIVQTPAESLAKSQAVLAKEKGPARDIILLNSAAALYCSGLYNEFADAVSASAEAIDSGLAEARFNQLRDLTQSLKRASHA